MEQTLLECISSLRAYKKTRQIRLASRKLTQRKQEIVTLLTLAASLHGPSSRNFATKKYISAKRTWQSSKLGFIKGPRLNRTENNIGVIQFPAYLVQY